MKRTTVLSLLFLAAVAILALNKVADTDAWMHLSMGRLIWQSGGLPATDPYVFTNEGLPIAQSYSAWLFGLALYGIMQLAGPAGLALAKAAVAVALFCVLLADSLRPFRNHAVALAVMTTVLVLARMRFVERPDIVAAVCLAFSIASLNAYAREGRKYLYALPFVHLLWANVHSSINLMVIPFAAFLAGGLLQRALSRRLPSLPAGPSNDRLRTIAVLFGLSFAASLLSPYGIRQYFFGASYLSSSFFMQMITELRPPTWSLTVWPWTFGAAVALSFVLNWRRSSVVDALLVLPFLVLPFTSVRFLFQLGIVGGPVLARNLSGWVEDRPWKTALAGRPAYAALACGIVLSAAFALANIFIVADSVQHPGIGIAEGTVPEKALAFMDGQGVGGRLFTILHWGGYVVWRDHPERTVYADPRVTIPPDLLESLYVARTSVPVLDQLSQRFGFEAMLVDYPNIPAGVVKLDERLGKAVHHPGWALVYWDDLTLLYLKRGGRFDGVIGGQEYRTVVPEVGLNTTRLADPVYRAQAERELERNIAATGSSRGRVLLGNLYNETGRHREALELFQKALDQPLAFAASAYSGMGFAYGILGDTERSLDAYLRAVKAEQDPQIMYRIGMLSYLKGDRKQAAKWLEEAVDRNPDMVSAYPLLATVYREMGVPDKAAAAEAKRQARLAAGAGEENFRRGLKAYSEKRLDEAEAEFQKALAANPANPATWSNLGYVHYDRGELNKAFEHQRRALELNPNYPSAHYALALIAAKRGDKATARKEWEVYLRLVPEGYFSRKAQEQLKALDGK